MDPRLKASLLWGAIGALSFLVLVQGYELLSAERLSFSLKFTVATIVGFAAAGSTYLAEPVLFDENGRV
ncbi:hypothetical protein [Halalkalicoccus jeotgali]|uniref:DUF7981 domain-containing protein n=1 Tax=Halalkalicoccus jeotgali (strain DSM 18796 / CECT 7217 / JCM 14584 / KCTC 4019 / B3) TaxID=795797 RepID=D8J5P8_HALJB|nr:hypothetical protein [Halalkalicoccus jeotgali]ADJ13704.1 hypothetical protein HacjB3_01555 [Halalkalicoccus jeotgali B3]ELY34249.1 hypothetical protein C497_17767 [Halalkalicoccus jeotgali B3]